jgi:nucleoside 2-deoxyribosyltransferase
MAMKYGDAELDRAFEHFTRAVAQTGFELRRPDRMPKAGLIDLRMRVEIRSAKFLIAELTDENRGAYWESGFAEGLGKKVYYTCEATKFASVKTHFDTEHMLTIKWDPVNMTPALDLLKSAIRNDFPTDAWQLDAR